MSVKKKSVKMGVDKRTNSALGLFKRKKIRQQNLFSLN